MAVNGHLHKPATLPQVKEPQDQPGRFEAENLPIFKDWSLWIYFKYTPMDVIL
jgi:hypothetical protein